MILAMSLLIDQLEKGDWIIVLGRKEINIEPEEDEYGDEIQQQSMRMISIEEPSGVPVKILAIDLPFLAVMPVVDPNSIGTVNLNTSNIKRANKEYVQAFKTMRDNMVAIRKGELDGSAPIIG